MAAAILRQHILHYPSRGSAIGVKFGIFDHLDKRDEPLQQQYTERLALVVAADRAGFDSYHLAEHHSTPIGIASSPSIFLSAVAQHTKTLRFGPMVYLLPFYKPLRLIEEICMLDNMSGGRLDAGVGRGQSPFELSFYGMNVAEAPSIFEEELEVILAGLSGDELNYESPRFQFHHVPMLLKPVQKPHPPLWYGVGSERSLKFAAEYGMNVFGLGPRTAMARATTAYREFWEAAADTPRRKSGPVGEPLIGASRHFYVAETDQEARRVAKPAYEHWYGNLTHLSGTFGFRQTRAIGDFDEALELGTVIVGSVETVSELLEQHTQETGINYAVLQLAFGCLTHAQEMASLELFASQVMPRFVETEAAA